jgi:excisionase family DNA binding protein
MPKMMTLRQIAETLSITERKARDLVGTYYKTGNGLRAAKVGARWRIDVRDLEKFLEYAYSRK